MALKISQKLKTDLSSELKIPKADVEEYVWNHKPHSCFLCADPLNRAVDSIELDHDVPTIQGGENELSNLNLTHAECNRYKGANKTFDVRPILKFQRYWNSKDGNVNFRDALEYFKVKPTDTYVSIDGDSAKFELPSGEVVASIFNEMVGGELRRFCFVSLPVSAVENDNETQPRNIKLSHLISICTDLKINPLHEQPACRIVPSGTKSKLLMFDGQHKAVAKILNDEMSVVFKVYLDLTKDQAVHLVNSIQSRIKKLPLTPFELASKMSDEVRRRLDDYEREVGSTEMSEAGFIKWLDRTEQARAKQGLASAIFDRIIGAESLAFKYMLSRPGGAGGGKITESAFQNKVLKVLLNTNPLSAEFKGEAMKVARDRETRHVLKVLSIIHDKGFEYNDDLEPEVDRERLKRIRYQAALQYACQIAKQIVSNQIFAASPEMTFIEKEVPQDAWDSLASAMERFYQHPIWAADLESTVKTRAVSDALSKNQNIDQAFRAVGLDAAYCVRLQELGTTWC